MSENQKFYRSHLPFAKKKLNYELGWANNISFDGLIQICIESKINKYCKMAIHTAHKHIGNEKIVENATCTFCGCCCDDIT